MGHAGRHAAGIAAAALAGIAAPAASADHTQTLEVGAQLVRQQPAGKPWIVNLRLGAVLGTTDGSVPSPVNHIIFSFTRGARVHPEAFATCTVAIIMEQGTDACPRSSRLGTGTATASALDNTFPARMQIFNGPKAGTKRKIIIYAVALNTVQIYIDGTLKMQRSRKYGWVLDLPIGRIRTVGDMDASILDFHATVGGIGRKGVPFIEAPTSCSGAGWPFLGRFTYADGATGSSSAVISCLLKATNND